MRFVIFVRKEYRGRGIGKKLLEKGIEIAYKKFQPENVWIDYMGGNEVARRLYEMLGFVEVIPENLNTLNTTEKVGI